MPNEKIITERIENYTLADPKVLVTTSVTLPGNVDLIQAQKILCDAALSVQRVLPEPAPGAFLAGFAPDGLDFTLAFWIQDPQNGQINARSDVNLAVLQGLRAAGISLPSPQREVRITQG